MLNYGISLFFFWFLFLLFFRAKGGKGGGGWGGTFTDKYGQQPSFQINFFVLKDHESSGAG